MCASLVAAPNPGSFESAKDLFELGQLEDAEQAFEILVASGLLSNFVSDFVQPGLRVNPGLTSSSCNRTILGYWVITIFTSGFSNSRTLLFILS
jgi:hypothetical protein